MPPRPTNPVIFEKLLQQLFYWLFWFLPGSFGFFLALFGFFWFFLVLKSFFRHPVYWFRVSWIKNLVLDAIPLTMSQKLRIKVARCFFIKTKTKLFLELHPFYRENFSKLFYLFVPIEWVDTTNILDAIASPSTYPCQWVGGWVIVSDFGYSY